MYGESFTMQNFIYRVLQHKFFTYKFDLLEETKFNYKKCLLELLVLIFTHDCNVLAKADKKLWQNYNLL
jgi:hypothetical protein